MNLSKVHHVAIIGSDYQKSRHFYVDLLGFEVIRENFRPEKNDWKIDLKLADMELELFIAPDHPKRPSYPEAYGLLRDGIAYFHIKDALYEGAIVPPGAGKAKIREILDTHSERADAPFFVTLEPHLQLFSGLNALVGRSFDNPYKYSDSESAFEDALKRLKELIS